MTIDLRAETEAVAAALDRHERRREHGLPTLSVLAGPVGLGLRQARAWAEARSRTVVPIASLDQDAALDAWAARLASERDLPRAAVAWLARRLGLAEADLDSRLRRMTPFERDTFLDDALADAAGTGLDIVAHGLLSRLTADPQPAAGPSATDGAESVAPGLPRHRLATALLELVPAGTAPLLLIPAARSEPPGDPPLERWAELAAGLVQAEPRLAVLLVTDVGPLDTYLGRAAETRARALVCESVVRVPALDPDALRSRLDDARPGLADAFAGPVARLGADGASGELADLFGVAAMAAEDVADAGPAADRARSAAERFLFERLESLPETAGRFRLNARPGFRFGPGHLMEVDLLADDLRLAVEVDGYYHFRDADAYRRDRRKDLELQRRGYLVVRVLADDIVRRLEEILATILDSVAHQARPASRS